MIEIISGFYGILSGSSVLLKKKEDGPFSLPEPEEKRLVDRKVAKYVDDIEAETSFFKGEKPDKRAKKESEPIDEPPPAIGAAPLVL